MRIVFYGSEHTAPALRMARWAAEAGHEIMWAGYLGDVSGDSPARHLKIHSNDNPRPELEALAAGFQPDIAHAFNFSFLTRFHLEAGLCPIVASAFGGFNPLISSPHPLSPDIKTLLETHKPPVIVESPLLLERGRAAFPDVPLELICLGVNPDHLKPVPASQRAQWRRALDIPQDAVLFFSGRGIGDGYRQDEILTAFAKALPQFPESAALALIRLTRGWDRLERTKALMDHAQQLGIAERIHWIPELRYEMMPGVYGMSDYVINFPVADAFPSTLLEAVSCEVPVITANLPAYAGSYIEQFCHLVDGDDADALAAGLVAAVNEPPRAREKRLAEASAYLGEHHHERDAKARLLALYDRLAGTEP